MSNDHKNTCIDHFSTPVIELLDNRDFFDRSGHLREIPAGMNSFYLIGRASIGDITMNFYSVEYTESIQGLLKCED